MALFVPGEVLPTRTGEHLEGKKVGREKTWGRTRREKKSAPRVENASQTDTESKTSSVSSRLLARATFHDIAKTTVFASGG